MNRTINVFIKTLFLFSFVLHSCWDLFKNKNNDKIRSNIVKSYQMGKMKEAYDLIEEHFTYDQKKPGDYFIQIKILLFLREFDKAKTLIEELQARDLCFDKLLKDELRVLKEDLEKEKEIYVQDLATHADAAHTREFLKYLYDHNCCSNSMNIFYNKYNVRGLKATKDIKAKDTIIFVDKSLLLTDSKANDYIVQKLATDDDKNQGDIFMSCLEYPKTSSLAIFILEHRHDVEYEQYFNIIFSNDYSSFPYFFDAKTRDILCGTTALEKIKEKEYIILHDWNEMQKTEAFKQYSYEDFKKAFCGVLSRTYGITVSPQEHGSCLAPFMDLENHNKETNTRWFFDQKDQHFKLVATKDIQKGEELLTSYGPTKSNTELLYTYGFALEDNKDNANIFINYKGSLYKCTDNVSKSSDNSGESELGNLLYRIYNDCDKKDKNARLKATFNTLLELCYQIFKNRIYNMNIIQKLLQDEKDTLSFNEKNCYYIVIEEQEIVKKIIYKLEEVVKTLAQDTSGDHLVTQLLSSKLFTDPEIVFLKEFTQEE